MSEKRFTDPNKHQLSSSDLEIERALRPIRLSDFYGQARLKENIDVFIQAALRRNEAMDHLLLHGPPGLGKTTLAHIIAQELKVEIRQTTGPLLNKPANLAGLLTHLEPRDVLFIDEIHRLSPVVEEYLYGAMEDFKIDILLEGGASTRSVQITLSPFTLVGATTRTGLLTAPLRARFGIKGRVSYYDTETLARIIRRNAQKLNIHIDTAGVDEISNRSRGTPRISNHLLRRTRDFAEIKGKGKITQSIAQLALNALEVDQHGLDEMDNRLLRTIIEKFNGGPVGISTLATACGEEGDTIEEVYEPFLIQEGYLKRTPRGREATTLAYQHLNKTPPSASATSLFDQ